MKNINIKKILLLILMVSCSSKINIREYSSNEELIKVSRPSILDIKEKNERQSPKWKVHLPSIGEFTAMILGFYNDHKIYFLSRDAELYYDMTKLIIDKYQSALPKNIKLLNVSRDGAKEKEYKFYLSQEGINDEIIQSGKKILLVDTGFSGTISKKTRQHINKKFRENIRSHFMFSHNNSIPSFRTGMVWYGM